MSTYHQVIEKIKKVLAQEDTVLFIGSGISLWSGLPTWGSLIDMLAVVVEENGSSADLIRVEKNKGDLLQAASYGFNKLSKHQIGNFIRKVCKYGEAKPHDIHKKIVTLGPRCFITTNYDDLIEQSLRIWQKDRFYRPAITNRHLTESTEIVHARAMDYIFKPHGDASDIESIVLTREQYRRLLPQGERYSALETLKMIMTTRPVVYLGFGLRDPDFIYVRDLLANTFVGGTRDHFAIMADVSQEEADFWRSVYGIHLVNYNTIERSDKSRDHSQLLKLLDDLLKDDEVDEKTKFDPASDRIILLLARHAARLSHINKLESEFEIKVTLGKTDKDEVLNMKFLGLPVDEFLINSPQKAILTGLPGSGKTYSMTKAVAALSDQLGKKCLDKVFEKKSVTIPVFADMKLYKGNIKDLINSSLSPDLPFDDLLRNYKIKIFIDSFNEMPKEYWDNGVYEKDFADFIAMTNECTLIISSRTTDGLEKFSIPIYSLGQIDKNEILKNLEHKNIKFEGRFIEDVLSLLQRPFFFHYIINKKVTLPASPHPRNFYESFFHNIDELFIKVFGVSCNIEIPLSLTAYEALNRGEETFSVNLLTRILYNYFHKREEDIDVKQIINWLVEQSVLIPYTNNRVSFVHQTITEYLAAKELANQYRSDPYLLQEKLEVKRWDQALFLTLSMLHTDEAKSFITEIVEIDFVLALNATKYLEFDRDYIVSILLEQVLKESSKFDFHKSSQIAFAIIKSVPVNHTHENILRRLIGIKGIIGSSAVELLIFIMGEQVKDEITNLIYENADDYNFCQGVGMALSSLIEEQDMVKIAENMNMIDFNVEEVSESFDEGGFDGYIIGIAHSVSRINTHFVEKYFLPPSLSYITPLQGDIICEVLWNRASVESLIMAGKLLKFGIRKAAFCVRMINQIADSKKIDMNEAWNIFDQQHIDCLLSLMRDGDKYSLDALSAICLNRSDLAQYLQHVTSDKSNFERVALSICFQSNDPELIFQFFSEILTTTFEYRTTLPFRILRSLDIDWKDRGEVFLQLLKLKDIRIISAISGSGVPVYIKNLPDLNFDSVAWVLDWIKEIASDEDQIWNVDRLGSIVALYSSEAIRQKLISEFNSGNKCYQNILKRFVLPYINNLTTDNFNDTSISYLIADLKNRDSLKSFRGHLLGITATESFVKDRLLPILNDSNDDIFMLNLRKVLDQAGSRHGRRYF